MGAGSLDRAVLTIYVSPMRLGAPWRGLTFTPAAGYLLGDVMEGDACGDGRGGGFTAAGRILPRGHLFFQPSCEGS